MWNDKSEPVIVDMEDIALFALSEGKASKVSAVENFTGQNESKFNLAENGAIEIVLHKKRDVNSHYIVLCIGWDSGAKVEIGILPNTMEISDVDVSYPIPNPDAEPLPEDDEDDFFDDYDLQEFKYFDPANWREAIMFAANEWWKDG